MVSAASKGDAAPGGWDGLDVSALPALAKANLLSLLDSALGAGNGDGLSLFLDPETAASLGLIVDVASLRQHGVERMFWLEQAPLPQPNAASGAGATAAPTSAPASAPTAQESEWRTRLRAVAAPTRSVVYICRPESHWMHVIAGHILADVQAAGPGAGPSQLMHSYTLFFAPQRTEICLTALSGGAGITPTPNSTSTHRPSTSKSAPDAHHHHDGYRPSVLPYLTIHDFALEFVPLAPDLLSLELPHAWKELYVDGLTSSVFAAAQALMTVQFAFGLFPRIMGKGDLAERLTSMLLSQREEQLASAPTSPALNSTSVDMDALIIIDRAVDQVSPLCTQLTYEGLLDELFGISVAHVEVPETDASASSAADTATAATSGSASGPAMAGSNNLTASSGPGPHTNHTQPASGTKKYHLSVSKDPLYQALRDANFAVIGPLLHEEAVKLNAEYEARRSCSTQQLHAFVRRLPALEARRASTSFHTHASGLILEASREPEFVRVLETEQALVAGGVAGGAAEVGSKGERAMLDMALTVVGDMIDARESLIRVVRLLCLTSLTTSGLPPAQFHSLRIDICQVYGHEALPLLLRLEQAGLLRRSAGSTGTSTGLAANLGSSLGLGAFSRGFGGVGKTKPAIPSKLGAGSGAASGSGAGVGTAEPVAPTMPVCPFALARRPLQLINDEVDESDPTDIAYVHSGYAPLSIRLVQAAGMKQAFLSTRPGTAPHRHPPRKAHRYIGWQGFEEIISSLPGSVVDVVQPAQAPPLDLDGMDSIPGLPTQAPTTSDIPASPSLGPGSLASLSPEGNPIRTTVVFFLGGVTYAEVAALRFMSRQLTDRKFLIATTNIISGPRIVQSSDTLGASAPFDLSAYRKPVYL